VPAAAVIPAPIVYMKVAAVKKLIVELRVLLCFKFNCVHPFCLGVTQLSIHFNCKATCGFMVILGRFGLCYSLQKPGCMPPFVLIVWFLAYKGLSGLFKLLRTISVYKLVF